MSALPSGMAAKFATQKVDLTTGAWIKLTLPGILAALVTVYGVVRYLDGIEAKLAEHDKSLITIHDNQREISMTLGRAIEAVAKIEGRLQKP